MQIGERRLIILAITINALYLFWLAFSIQTGLGIFFFILELLTSLLFFLYAINHIDRKYQLMGGTYNMRAIVDIWILTKNESIALLEETIKSALFIEYPNKRVYVFDDGARQEVQELCRKLDVRYFSRSDREDRKYKAANLNFALSKSYGSFILVLDADQVAYEQILDTLLGYFNDSSVALVTTRQRFAVQEGDFNEDHLFYEYMQPGKNAQGVAISCGSGVIYRRSALLKIGGFPEWNIVEDLTTTYELACAGYKTMYVNQSFTKGDAPFDLRAIYRQRGTWAADSIRLLFKRNPLFEKKLTFLQRLHFFELGYLYLVSGVVLPTIYLLSCYALVRNEYLFEGIYFYLALRLPAFILTHLMYQRFSQGTASMRMWAGLFPVYLVSLVRAISPVLKRSQPTPKRTVATQRALLVLPQLFFYFIGISAIVRHLSLYGTTPLLVGNLFWIILYMYWIFPVVRSGLVFVSPKKDASSLSASLQIVH